MSPEVDTGRPADPEGRETGRGLLFIVSAPSGAGKTTLCRALRDRFPGLAYSVSSTTRPPRKGEVDGRDYHFVDREAFEAGIETGRWAEWARVHQHFYGTAAETLSSAIDAGRDLLLDIDVQGTRQILQCFPDSVTIFIMPPSADTLRQRLELRGTDDPATIERRMAAAASEMAARDIYRHVIVNDRLGDAVDELVAVVETCRNRRAAARSDRP